MKKDSRLDILARASIFEDDFSIDWVIELTGKKALLVLSALEYGCENQWIENRSTGIFCFKDLDMLSKLRSFLDASENSRLHACALEILSSELPDMPEKNSRLTRHLLKIRNNVQGCRLLMKEGNQHRKACRMDKARLYYDKALEDLEIQAGETADSLFLEVTLHYAKIWTAGQSYQVAKSILKRAIAKAKTLSDKTALPLLRLHLAYQELFFGEYEAAKKQVELGRAMISESGNPALNRPLKLFNMFFLYWQGTFKETFSHYEAHIPAIETPPESRFDCFAKLIAGHASGMSGNITQGIGMADAVLAHSTKMGDLGIASYASLTMGSLLGDLERFEDACHYYEKAMEQAQNNQSNRSRIYSLLSLAHAKFRQNETKKSLTCLKEYLALSEKTGFTVVQDPFLLEMAWAMEQGTYPKVDGICFATLLEQTEKSHNVFMQGMALYYRAMAMETENLPGPDVIGMYEKAMDKVAASGHQLCFIRVGLSLARYLRQQNRDSDAIETALPLVKTLYSMDKHLIPDDFLFLVKESIDQGFLLTEMLKLGQEIANMRNPHDLLGKIISMVNRITAAERGAIFLAGKTPDDLRLEAAKNLTQEQIHSKGFAASMKIVEEIARSEKGGIFEFEPRQDADSELSEWERIRSLICVPMRINNRLVGVLYHDNRLFQSVFKESDLDILNYFAAQAAIAIDNARVYQTLESLYKKEKEEKKYYEEQYMESLAVGEIVGKSPAITKVFSMIESVARTDTTVLVTGETGVGKELVARALHRNSLRTKGPFIRVNCAALPESLIASELFGHEKGAFTGATKQRIGRFELADGGTIFLDEIGDISPYIQVRLLRVLQNHEFERVGSQKTIKSNFRLITATNKDLKDEVKKGRFREDLFYRLNIFPIRVPALRNRAEDIPILVHHFLNKSAERLNKVICKIPRKEVDKLMAYTWPGNVRELENIVERGVILSKGPLLKIPTAEFQSATHPEDNALSLEDMERRHIMEILKQTRGKINGKSGAAQILKLHPSTLRFRIKKLGLVIERSPARV
ncbi:MAG: GAF domain-containing protein [Desulfobacteraceae bacterium]|nr:GAF domain-containing protein [Desulfobacteraceae bacterium]